MAAALGFGQQTSAQGLTYSLFERYLESLRQQAAIPGLSAAIVQNGTVVWEKGLGQATIEGNITPTPSTPYLIGDASQVFSSAVLLKKCVDQSYLSTSDRVIRWFPRFPDAVSTVGDLLSHATAGGTFQYDLARYGALTTVTEQCANVPYAKLLATEIFDRLGMTDSVPGQAAAIAGSDTQRLFDTATVNRYASVLSQLATPYHVDSQGRASRSNFAGQPLDASGGVITTVRDLVKFDTAMRDSGVVLSASARQKAWTNAVVNGTVLPTGLGWFVQKYNQETLVWQFGMVKDAYSSLILKLQDHDMTLILLANSDGLSSPFALANGDVTTSLFAKIFLRLFAS